MRFGLAPLITLVLSLLTSTVVGQTPPPNLAPLYSMQVPGFPGADGHDSVAACGSEIFYIDHSVKRIRHLGHDETNSWVDSEFAPQGTSDGYSAVRVYGQGKLLAALYASAYSGHRIDLFEREPAGHWTHRQTIAAPQGSAFVWVNQLQWSGSSLMVVDRYADDFRGAAFIFTRDVAGVWRQSAKLQGSGVHPFFTEVWSAAFDGQQAVLGHWLNNCGYQAVSGTAYVFERDQEGHWAESAALRPASAQCGDAYAANVTIRGAHAYASANGPNRIYHFKHTSMGWVQATDVPLPNLSGNPAQGVRLQATAWGFLSRTSDSRLIAYAEHDGVCAPIAVLTPSQLPPGDCYCWNIACEGTRVVTMSGLPNGQAAISVFELRDSLDCNNDGIVDYGQILTGQLADANGNAIPDICEAGFIRATANAGPPSASEPIRDFDHGEGWTVGIRPNGELTSWGWYSAAVPSGQFKSVSAGGACAIAIRMDDTLAPFGDNAYGRLDVPAGTFRMVSAADASWHAAGIRTDGTLACWGYNSEGQCNAPAGSFVHVAVGGHQAWSPFSLAVRSDGTLAAWGNNTWGQCSVTPGSGFRKVAAGYYHAAALRDDNSLAAWGWNNNGQATPAAGPFVDVSCGTATLALRADGTVQIIGTVEPQTHSLLSTLTDVTKVQMICCDSAVALLRTDCDADLVFDAVEVNEYPALDLDRDGALDSCECPTDSDGDSVLDCVDGCPNDANKTSPGICGCGVSDADTDGDGTADCNDGCPNDANKTSPGVCGCGVSDADTDGDGTADCNDGCPNDPHKTSAGICGCGSADLDVDGDGRTDCRDVELHMSVLSIDRTPGGIVQLRVEARTLQPVVEMVGMQCAMAFDSWRMSVVDISPVVGSPLSLEISEQVNQDAGTIRYALGSLPPSGGFTGTTALFDVTLQFHWWAWLCDWTELGRFTTVDGFGSMLVAADASSVQPSESTDTWVQLDVTPPEISGVPSPVSLACDAGTSQGAHVDEWMYWPSIYDPCGVGSDRVIILPDGGWYSWYWPERFPIGTSMVWWRAWDGLGNYSDAFTTITVEPHQLLDATVVLEGSFAPELPPFNRMVRIESSARASLHAASFVPSGPEGRERRAYLTGVSVPVVDGTPCMRAKDTAYSITALGSATVTGPRFAVEFALSMGDSNNDDAVDIIDFGSWYVDVGPAAVDARSNFNADGFVNNADFGWIGLNFFRSGAACSGAAPPSPPLARISIKELRRRGLGQLADADLNRDGWLDERDVAIALGSANPPEAAAPDADARVE